MNCTACGDATPTAAPGVCVDIDGGWWHRPGSCPHCAGVCPVCLAGTRRGLDADLLVLLEHLTPAEAEALTTSLGCETIDGRVVHYVAHPAGSPNRTLERHGLVTVNAWQGHARTALGDLVAEVLLSIEAALAEAH